MLRTLFPVIFAGVFILAIGLIEVALLRLLNKEWWHRRWIRRFAWGLPVSGIVALCIWAFGEYAAIDWLVFPFRLIAGAIFISEAALMLALPISGVFHATNSLWDRLVKRKKREIQTIDMKRRLFLKSAAAVVPVATLTMATGGTVKAFRAARLFKKPMSFTGMAPSLDKLKILQLSDLHLYHYVTLSDLEKLLERIEPHKPDLVLVTGDVADDLRQLPSALKLISDLKPRLGTYGSLGNHEYFRGIANVRRIFDSSPVPLFVNSGITIPVGNASLFVGGVDDPRSISIRNENFFKETIDKCLSYAGETDFKVLMSHRPDAFDYAAEQKIDLTLAGHTHGGQIGLFGRSVFESYFPEKYLWGEYRLGQSLLYTTSGAGHWFPFRLGCPAEAPLIQLSKDPAPVATQGRRRAKRQYERAA